jgi:hypothetical protein
VAQCMPAAENEPDLEGGDEDDTDETV